MVALNRHETSPLGQENRFGFMLVGGGGIDPAEIPELPIILPPLENGQLGNEEQEKDKRTRVVTEVGDMATGAAVSIGEQSTGVHQPPHPRVGGDSRVAEFVN